MAFAHPAALTRDQVANFEAEVDAIRADVMNHLGQADVDRIRRMMRICRASEVGGRALLHFGLGPISWVAGVLALANALVAGAGLRRQRGHAHAPHEGADVVPPTGCSWRSVAQGPPAAQHAARRQTHRRRLRATGACTR